jgi:hypothetical protein
MQPNKAVTILAILLILTPGMVFVFAPRLVADAVVAVEHDDIWLVSDAARAFHAEITAREAALSAAPPAASPAAGQ